MLKFGTQENLTPLRVISVKPPVTGGNMELSFRRKFGGLCGKTQTQQECRLGVQDLSSLLNLLLLHTFDVSVSNCSLSSTRIDWEVNFLWSKPQRLSGDPKPHQAWSNGGQINFHFINLLILWTVTLDSWHSIWFYSRVTKYHTFWLPTQRLLLPWTQKIKHYSFHYTNLWTWTHRHNSLHPMVASKLRTLLWTYLRLFRIPYHLLQENGQHRHAGEH